MDNIKRKFIMLRTDDETKELYKRAAKESGHESVSAWLRFLIFKALRKIKKEGLMVFVCLLFSSGAFAFEVDLSLIKKIESGGCQSPCVGDSGLALGEFQLHKGAVSDASRYLRASHSHQDALEPKKAWILANAYINGVIPSYLGHYGLNDTLENRLTAYNMGISAVKKGLSASRYIKKYKNLERGKHGTKSGTA